MPPPPAPEFKREEEEALRLFEQALALRPDHARTHLAMAELLAPHTLGRHQAEQAAQKVRAGRRGKPPAALPSPAADVDTEADRVIRAYRMATQGDPVWTEPLDGLIRFCMQMGRLAEADAAFQELIHRDKAKPEPLTRYGDFLLNERKDPQGAIARYREALMWRSDDEAAQRRLAEVFLSMGSEHYHKKEYAVAEARFREAQKYIKDPKSPEAIKLQAYLAELARIRQR